MVSTPTLPWKFQNLFQIYQASSPFRPAGALCFEAPAFAEGAVSPSLAGLLRSNPVPAVPDYLRALLEPSLFRFPYSRPSWPSCSSYSLFWRFRHLMGPTTLLPPIFKSFHWPRRSRHAPAGLMTGRASFRKHPATEA
jgi:hypothetical protein